MDQFMSEAAHVSAIIPFASAVLVWWLGTVLLLAVTRKLSVLKIIGIMFVSAILMQLGFFGLYYFSHHLVGNYAAYGAFLSTILIWVWLESSFLVGWVTGPRKVPCSPNLRGFERANQAFRAVLHHEIHIAVLALGIFLVTKDTENYVGLYAFLILWGMRTSSKLNLFFGVRNLYINFLPDKIAYLSTYFRQKSCNALFPFLFALAFTINVLFWNNALMSFGTSQHVGNILLASLMTLGVLEHILMVVPFNCNGIWRFGLTAQK